MKAEDDLIHQRIQSIIIEIIAVLHCNGITTINVGAMMRLLGVDKHKAEAHDCEIIEIDEKFGQLLTSVNRQPTVSFDVPKGTVFH